MSRQQAFQEAIEAFQPGGADAPVLYSSVEVSKRSFTALAGRKLKLWSTHTTILVVVCIVFLAVISVATVIWSGNTQTAPVPAIFMPLFIALLFRTTLITVTNDGLNFYFLESRFGSKYVVSDKLSLPYDRISNVRVKVGKFNTHITFSFLHNDKTCRIKTTIPSKMRKMEEHEGNLNYLLEMLEKKAP